MNDDQSPGGSLNFLNRIDWKEIDSITIEGRLLTIKVSFSTQIKIRFESEAELEAALKEWLSSAPHRSIVIRREKETDTGGQPFSG
jgi:hypothetical protein